MTDERKLVVQAVLEGQLPPSYMTEKELMTLYDRLWEKCIEPLLPHKSVVLH